MWKADLKQINEKAAEALADPAKYPNLFPDLDLALKVDDLPLPSSRNADLNNHFLFVVCSYF